MRAGIFFVFFILTVLLFKAYIIRGIWQATNHFGFSTAYGIFSVSTLVLGVLVMLRLFSGGMIGLSFWQNFATALMTSLIICEVLLGIFFLIDDLWYWIKPFISSLDNTSTADGSSRRRVIKTLGLGISALPFAAYLYGITKGKYDYKVFEKTLTFPDLPEAFDGFKIVQFSDLHSGSFDSIEGVKKGFDLMQKQQADLILFTGDLVNNLADEVLPYKEILKNLSAPLGKFSVLGNHDYAEPGRFFEDKEAAENNLAAIKQHHSDMGFQLLNNDSIQLEKEGNAIRLLGVENWGTRFVKFGDLDQALEGCPENEFRILLSHDPTHWEYKVLAHPTHIHLTLSGHTHGMQMGIERWGIRWSPSKYVYPRWAGLYEEKKQYLYVNRGFGFIGFAGRVGIKPEITTLTLRRG